MTKYSSQFAVTAVHYGAGATEIDARTAALQQCRAADWVESFCASGAMTCVTEPAKTTSCTFSKYSSQFAQTANYYGSGDSETAGKAAAVKACLDTRSWRGWFCTSGSVTCP